VTTHQADITLNGWTGSGYVILDPETGAGAYKISGGSNGSFTERVMFSTFIVLTGLFIALLLFSPFGWLGLALIVLELVNFRHTLDAMRTINDADAFNKLMFISILLAILIPLLSPFFIFVGAQALVLFCFLYAFVWGFEHLWF